MLWRGPARPGLMPDPLIVFGSGGHAKVVVEAVLMKEADRKLILLDDATTSCRQSVFGIRVFGGRPELEQFRGCPVIVAIGDNYARSELISWLRQENHRLQTVIHPAAIVGASVEIGDGSFLGAGAIAIAETRIGRGAIINTGATVDHDCVIGEASHVGPGAHLCGGVRIGTRTLIGVGASIRPGIAICEDVVVGAGSVVVKDIDQPGTYAGNPARIRS